MVSVISTALIVLEKYKVPLDTFFWRSIFDTGHIPLFGVISIALLGLSQTIWERRFSNPLIHYIIALCLTGLLGLTTEIIQYFTPRDADIWDIVNDGIGAVCFLGLYLTFDRRLRNSGISLSRKRKYLIRVTIIIIGIITLLPVFDWIGAYTNRNISFPDICTFESDWEQKFVFTGHASLSIVSALGDFDGKNNNYVGRVDFKKSRYPKFSIEEPYPDWTGYEYFSFSIFSELPETINIELRINDRRHENKYDDRFNRTFSISPGINKISVPLNDIAVAPKDRLMDMRNIYLIILFIVNPENELTIYLDNFKLE